ncbi:uncharacterized protein LOC111709894 [Eurytemora carolleeae]|uniref:uncharacterized protein LOC111709894 n=1 Tax=Eurytemora carolleeae TaxID=1294199 RepID=UPI000C76E107|nr:uncharacterized protein LOC111709894 [Eurytemora carolleeae]|eukprot:XP_023339600.1 uncharacterized protein LOC111709894 [Eurytemora affinis]
MWPNTFNKKCATISGWQCLGDFAAVKQQLQKIRASTRIPPRKDEEGRGASRPLPPLPGQNKSVRFNIPDGLLPPSGSEGSDQGYESDQSRERRRQLESQGLYGARDVHGRQVQYTDRELSASSPVLLQLYDAIKVEGEGNNPPEDNVKAALARLASNENLNSSYDLVLGLVRRPPPPHTCRHPPPSPPPPQPRHQCPCHSQHHHRCSGSSSRKSRSRPSSPGPSSSQSRSRPSSPFNSSTNISINNTNSNTLTKSRWTFGKKAKRSASAERRPHVELGWGSADPRNRFISRERYSETGRYALERGRERVQVDRFVGEGRENSLGKWEDTGSKGWEFKWEGSVDVESATNTASLAGDLCRRATALRRTLYKMPGLINQRTAFLEIIKDVASEMKLLLDSAARLAPLLPERQRQELDMARRKLLETSRSFSTALKGYFKEPQATPVLLAATALVYRTDEIIQSLEP